MNHTGFSLNGFFVGVFSNLESQGDFSKSQIFGGNKTGQENVNTFSDTERHSDNTICSGFTIQTANKIREIIQDTQIMFNDNDIVIVSHNASNNLSGGQSLSDIEIRTGFIKHIHVGILDGDNGNGESLQLSSGQVTDFTVQNISQFQIGNNLILDALLIFGIQNSIDVSFNCVRDVIHILGLDSSLQILFQNFGEVILQF
mmetsp:Transcript_11110/g.12173  ORF Transcript_11110/g.12173 Transcript_11110/m.12173 type:complete len:201 (+) Transcript_11110:208-810(+)